MKNTKSHRKKGRHTNCNGNYHQGTLNGGHDSIDFTPYSINDDCNKSIDIDEMSSNDDSSDKNLIKIDEDDRSIERINVSAQGDKLNHTSNISFQGSLTSQDTHHSMPNITVDTDTPVCGHKMYDSKLRKSIKVEQSNRYTLDTITRLILNTLGFGDYYDVEQNSGYVLIEYLHWTFRASFTVLFFAFIAKFMILILIFSGFIALANVLQPTCITPGIGNFSDIFALSWTTFTTVGYGNIYPSLSHQETEAGHCTFIAFLTSMEAFIGVLFAGFSGAIIFGKVLRIQSQAQVRFSDLIMICYGRNAKNRPSSSNVLNNKSPSPDMIACPMLEFRIVNRLYNKPGCEIIDANLNCMVLKTEYHGNSSPSQRVSDSISYKNEPNESITTGGGRKAVAIDTDLLDVDYCVHKLEIEMYQHAFFKRVWTARHIMDGYSPVLTSNARKHVRANGGYWPKELNSSEGVRSSIEFDQIVVNLSGTSNISAASVYAQKIYTDDSMKIGARFLNMVYKHDSTGRIMLQIDDIDVFADQDS